MFVCGKRVLIGFDTALSFKYPRGVLERILPANKGGTNVLVI